VTQLCFESFFRSGLRSRLRFYVGYSFGGREVEGWTHGVVCTPRWVRAAMRETRLSVVLDNGAFPAWRDGIDLSYDDQISSMLDALHIITPARVLWVILPDVVGDAVETRRRSEQALADLDVSPSVCLAPYQEGADAEEFAAWVRARGIGGAFIGGATKEWKRLACSQLVDRVPWVHVARISADHELHWAAYLGADSFDSTTPTRGFTHHQTAGRERDWAASFSRYCEAAR